MTFPYVLLLVSLTARVTQISGAPDETDVANIRSNLITQYPQIALNAFSALGSAGRLSFEIIALPLAGENYLQQIEALTEPFQFLEGLGADILESTFIPEIASGCESGAIPCQILNIYVEENFVTCYDFADYTVVDTSVEVVISFGVLSMFCGNGNTELVTCDQTDCANYYTTGSRIKLYVGRNPNSLAQFKVGDGTSLVFCTNIFCVVTVSTSGVFEVLATYSPS